MLCLLMHRLRDYWPKEILHKKKAELCNRNLETLLIFKGNITLKISGIFAPQHDCVTGVSLYTNLLLLWWNLYQEEYVIFLSNVEADSLASACRSRQEWGNTRGRPRNWGSYVIWSTQAENPTQTSLVSLCLFFMPFTRWGRLWSDPFVLGNPYSWVGAERPYKYVCARSAPLDQLPPAHPCVRVSEHNKNLSAACLNTTQSVISRSYSKRLSKFLGKKSFAQILEWAQEFERCGFCNCEWRAVFLGLNKCLNLYHTLFKASCLLCKSSLSIFAPRGADYHIHVYWPSSLCAKWYTINQTCRSWVSWRPDESQLRVDSPGSHHGADTQRKGGLWTLYLLASIHFIWK